MSTTTDTTSVLGPPPPPSDEEASSSYTDTYFREIGITMNQQPGNANTPADHKEESSEIDGDDDNAVDGDGLLEDVSLAITPLEQHSEDESSNSNATTPKDGQSLKPTMTTLHKRLTMASAFAANPFHSYFGQKPMEDTDDVAGNNARYGSITLKDDASVSTLGEESTKDKSKSESVKSSTQDEKDQASVSTLDEDSTKRASLTSENVNSTTKEEILLTPPPLTTVTSWDLKPSETASTEEDSQVYSSYEFMLMRRKKCLFFLMAFSTMLLLASILVLGISFRHQRLVKDDEALTFETENRNWDPESNRTVTPDSVTASPTTVDHGLLALEDLVEILSVVSPNSLLLAADSSSSQFLAMEWLSHDPEYFTYSVERIVQRWTLAVLAYSLGADMLPLSQRSLQAPSALLSYEHECQWFSSVTTGEEVCDTTERMIGIYLDNHGLAGTIPPEIGLLQDSIGKYSRCRTIVELLAW